MATAGLAQGIADGALSPAAIADFQANAERWQEAASGLATPCLVVDAEGVRRNIRRLADYAVAHHLGIRPHTKTHKSKRIGTLQIQAGAVGLAVAKAGEAVQMAEASEDLLVAYPAFDLQRRQQLARLARGRMIRVAVDSIRAAESLAEAAREAHSVIGVLIDIDVGLHRTGVPGPSEALALAQQIDRLSGLRLDGLFCYPGQIWGTPESQADPLARVGDIVRETLDLLKRDGLSAAIVSGGSTPTAYQSHHCEPLTEIRPGTYVFNDMNTFRGGYCRAEDCAAAMICTVVSDAVRGQVVIDAGTKTLTSDRCIPALDSGHGLILEYPEAVITRLSEEHGQVDVTRCSGGGPALGERVTVIPNHICPCVNLRDEFWWLETGREPEPWTVDARGLLS